MRIKEMLPGQDATIVAFTSGAAEYRQRLLMLGLIPGTQFQLQRLAPLGDPVEIKVRGSLVSLRKDEADVMEVEVAGKCSTLSVLSETPIAERQRFLTH